MSVATYSFEERLCFSKATVAETCEGIILDLLPGCVHVERTGAENVALDIAGVDYTATLRRGAQVFIDHKTRDPGCSRFWRNKVPELALEKWSVVPEFSNAGKAGWTLDESKVTDYTLHTFDRVDSSMVYLLPFQLLRVAFKDHIEKWYRQYRSAEQESHRDGYKWRSECIFIPAPVVVEAIRQTMATKVSIKEQL